MSESRATVAQNAVSGVAWNVVISLAARVVGVASTLFVTRFISPGDYGEVMGAAIVANSCLALSQLGLAQYIVARPSVGPSETFHATFYGTTVCVLLLVVALAAETHLAPYFRVQELPHYLPWMALVVLMDRVVTIPERLLYRDMRFRTAALNRATGEIVYAVLAVGLVAAGAGGMGLVVAGLARSLLRAVVIVAMVHWRRWAEPCRLTWVTTTELFGYGLPLSAGNIAGFISTRWDNQIGRAHV